MDPTVWNKNEVYFFFSRTHLFYGIEFLEILRNVFIKVAKIEETKTKIKNGYQTISLPTSNGK